MSSSWTLDPTRNEYYWVDNHAQCYVYASGKRIPFPPSTSTGNEHPQQNSLPAQSDPRTTGHYRNSSNWTIASGLSDLSIGRTHTGIDSVAHDHAYTTAPTGAGLQGRAESFTRHDEQHPSQTAAVPRPNDDEILQQLGRNVDTVPSYENAQPDLRRENPKVYAHRRLKPTAGRTEKLDDSFAVQAGDAFFKTGVVFKVLWPELAGDTNGDMTIVTNSRFEGEKIFAKIRWFVVVREGYDCCSCLSIQTYGRRGVPDNKVKAHHAMMYTGTTVPSPLQSELPVGTIDRAMGPPIRVLPYYLYEKLDPLSRVNFFKIYTVEHNVKVRPFGKVDKTDEWKLISQFNSAWGIPGISPPGSIARHQDSNKHEHPSVDKNSESYTGAEAGNQGSSYQYSTGNQYSAGSQYSTPQYPPTTQDVNSSQYATALQYSNPQDASILQDSASSHYTTGPQYSLSSQLSTASQFPMSAQYPTTSDTPYHGPLSSIHEDTRLTHSVETPRQQQAYDDYENNLPVTIGSPRARRSSNSSDGQDNVYEDPRSSKGHGKKKKYPLPL